MFPIFTPANITAFPPIHTLFPAIIGFAYSKDNDLQKEFENTFAYDLTDDQEKAIYEVKEDMVLICKPGMRIAVDGIVTDGITHTDESFLNGAILAETSK